MSADISSNSNLVRKGKEERPIFEVITKGKGSDWEIR